MKLESIDELRDKCRTCRYMSLNEGNWSNGYCWQCNMPVDLRSFVDFPKEHDPRCQEIIGREDELLWEPLRILRPYFDEEKQ